jgi:hypothetical protein
MDSQVATRGGLQDRIMNTHLFASVGRWVAPLIVAATTFVGTLGFSSVASADERGRDGVVAEHGHRDGARRGWEHERGGRDHHGRRHDGRRHDGRRGDHRGRR